MTKARLVYILRLVVGLTIIAGLFWFIDVDELPGPAQVRLPYALAVLLVAFALRLLNAYKWKVLVGAAGLSVQFKELLRIYFASGFVGLLLPSSVGGEFLKGYGLAKSTSETIDSASTVVVDRVTGFVALTSVCVVGYSLADPGLQKMPIMQLVRNISVFALIGTVMALSVGMITPETYLTPNTKDGRLLSLVRRIGRSFYQYRNEVPSLSVAMAASVGVQLLRVVMVWLAGLAVSLYADAMLFVVLVPFIQLGSLVPLTMSGIGVQEGAAVYLFSLVGAEAAATLSMYLLVRVMAVVSVSPGAWVYFREGLAGDGGTSAVEPLAEVVEEGT